MSRARLAAWGIFFAGVALVAVFYVMTVPGSGPTVVNAEPGQAGGPQIEITVAGEAQGRVVIELFDTIAPENAARLVTLAQQGAYDGVVFHRVIDGFMAQTGDVQYGKAGGDMRRAGTGSSQFDNLPAEFSKEPFLPGTVGMARTSDPDTANAQFFIMFDAAPHLDGAYTVVGRVIEGMDVVNQIKRGDGPNGSVIGTPDVMQSVRVIKE